MSIVSEIIYIVPEEREQFLREHVNPSKEIQRILWKHGMRKIHYFELNDLILRSYEYVGQHYYQDMAAIASYPATKAHLVQRRRRDVPEDQRKSVNWWAPLKRQGHLLVDDPFTEEDVNFDEQYRAMMSGSMDESEAREEFRYDEDDWSESVHF